MSYSAYLSTTRFRLATPVSKSIKAIEKQLAYHLDGYEDHVSLESADDVHFMLCMEESEDVGDSFVERVQDTLKAISPYVRDGFAVTVRNCDTASDDRDTMLFGGPNEDAKVAARIRFYATAALENINRNPEILREVLSHLGIASADDVVEEFKAAADPKREVYRG